LRWQQLGGERRGEDEEGRKGASGKDKTSRRRRCLDFERELLRKWHMCYNVFPLIFQRAEGLCGNAHKTLTTLSVLGFQQPPCFSESLVSMAAWRDSQRCITKIDHKLFLLDPRAHAASIKYKAIPIEKQCYPIWPPFLRDALGSLVDRLASLM
jgi:hypothetical protein